MKRKQNEYTSIQGTDSSSDDDRSSFLDTTNKRLNGMTIGANKITIANFR